MPGLLPRLKLPRTAPMMNLRVEREAITLIELLAVLSIVSIVVVLLLPAVQSSRETARRMLCQNNLRQLAMAMQNHHSAKKRFPAGRARPFPRVFSCETPICCHIARALSTRD